MSWRNTTGTLERAPVEPAMSDEPLAVESTTFPEGTMLGEKTIGSVPADPLPPPPLRGARPPLPQAWTATRASWRRSAAGAWGSSTRRASPPAWAASSLWKMLRPSVGLVVLGEWDGLLDRFPACREAEALARLRHPHIVEVYDIGNTPAGPPGFPWSSVPAAPWTAGLRRHPLCHPPRRPTSPQTLAQAMQAAHAEGIIHRDLKPANVLLAGSEGERAPRCAGGPARR